ncbi:MAG: AAA family ATPase [Bacteroidetes bacterium]|nr:AAA family ATPase [Bacteroidota bacterium]
MAINGPRHLGKTTIALQLRRRLIESKTSCWYLPMDKFNSHESDWHEIRSEYASQRDGAIHDNRDDDGQHCSTSNITGAGAPPNGQVLVEVWERARRESLKSERGLVLIIDEIQIIPRWSNIVKGLWDADRRNGYQLRVVVIGSPPWRLMIGQNESLAGRFDFHRVTHWSLPEMTQAFGLTVEEYMFFGGYPGPFCRDSEGITLRPWRDHILTAILTHVTKRDIMGLTRFHNPVVIRQLIDLSLRYSGNFIYYKKLLEKLPEAGDVTTLVDYLYLLSNANLIVTLDNYSRDPLRRKKSPQKLYALNTALMTATSGYTFQEARADRSFWERIVKSAVGAHLYNTRGTVTRIHYWQRDSGKYYVDFVISRGPHLVGVEVKSGNKRASQGLSEFKARYKNARVMEVGPGVNAVSFNDFFSLTTDEWIEGKSVKS